MAVYLCLDPSSSHARLPLAHVRQWMQAHRSVGVSHFFVADEVLAVNASRALSLNDDVTLLKTAATALRSSTAVFPATSTLCIDALPRHQS